MTVFNCNYLNLRFILIFNFKEDEDTLRTWAGVHKPLAWFPASIQPRKQPIRRFGSQTSLVSFQEKEKKKDSSNQRQCDPERQRQGHRWHRGVSMWRWGRPRCKPGKPSRWRWRMLPSADPSPGCTCLLSAWFAGGGRIKKRGGVECVFYMWGPKFHQKSEDICREWGNTQSTSNSF